jgi:predicted deacetylase
MTELDKIIAEQTAWNRTYFELLLALTGDRRAIAENRKKVDLMRQREERGEDPNRGK